MFLQIRTDNQSRVNWQHFLHLYNPAKAPHALESHKAASTSDLDEWGHHSTHASAANTTAGSPALMRSPPRSAGGAGAGIGRNDPLPDMEKQYRDKMKKCWQKLLKECQRVDSARVGAVSRNDFLFAVSSSGLEKVIAFIAYYVCLINYAVYLYLYRYLGMQRSGYWRVLLLIPTAPSTM